MRSERLALVRALEHERLEQTSRGAWRAAATRPCDDGTEPRFMAPTASTGYRTTEVPLAGADAGYAEPALEQLPEWAAPAARVAAPPHGDEPAA